MDFKFDKNSMIFGKFFLKLGNCKRIFSIFLAVNFNFKKNGTTVDSITFFWKKKELKSSGFVDQCCIRLRLKQTCSVILAWRFPSRIIELLESGHFYNFICHDNCIFSFLCFPAYDLLLPSSHILLMIFVSDSYDYTKKKMLLNL